MVDLMADYLARAQAEEMPSLPWLEPAAQAERWRLAGGAEGGGDPAALLADYIEASQHLHHPGTMGHQVPGPLPVAALADAVAGLLNNSAAVYEMSPAATIIEREVVAWMCQTLGLGDGSGGVLTSGGSLGTLRALLAARQARVAGLDSHRLSLLVGAQAHYSVSRAAAVMGMAPEAVVPVPVDQNFRLDPGALAGALTQARRGGRTPLALVATAGSTAVGAFDPLEPAAEFCRVHNLWLHVDAAHGGAAALSPSLRWRLDGIGRADSVVWDGHKMLLLPSLVTGVLFRQADHCLDTFSQDASYLLGNDPREEWFNLSHQTLECTKNAMALKLWLALKVVGADAIGALVERLFALAGALAQRLTEADDFELALAPAANIVCFRHLPQGGAPDLNAHQSRLREAVIRGGSHYLVQTQLNGETHLRVTLMNPATTEAHLDGLLEALRAATRK